MPEIVHDNYKEITMHMFSGATITGKVNIDFQTKNIIVAVICHKINIMLVISIKIIKVKKSVFGCL